MYDDLVKRYEQYTINIREVWTDVCEKLAIIADSHSDQKETMSEFRTRAETLANAPTLLQSMVKRHGLSMTARLQAVDGSVKVNREHKGVTMSIADVTRQNSFATCDRTIIVTRNSFSAPRRRPRTLSGLQGSKCLEAE